MSSICIFHYFTNHLWPFCLDIVVSQRDRLTGTFFARFTLVSLMLTAVICKSYLLRIFHWFLFLKVILFVPLRMYGTKCSGCKTTIPANEFVMRALGNVYHIQCFVCTMCGHRLEKGQEFALKDNILYCKDDYGKLPSKGSSISPPHKQQQESKSKLLNVIIPYRFVVGYLFG